jgi:hypothetical protein
MRIFKTILLLTFVSYSIANAQFPASLNAAFTEAGKNQLELKAVLKHYSAHKVDSLKKKAAIFLIQNMDIHQSYRSKAWDDYQAELDSLFGKEERSAELSKVFYELHRKYTLPLNDIAYVSDLQTITAKFLTYSIDKAFEAWKSPYAHHLNFDDFCEYILPYRVGEELLCDWRKEFTENFIPGIYTRIKAQKDSITARQICDAIKTYPYANVILYPAELPDYNAHLLSVMRVGSCREYSLQAILAARALGVPVALDYTPQWANRRWSHEWNALIDRNNKPLAFGIGDKVDLGKHIESVNDRIAPKIYRETFAKQATSLAMICGNEEIPNTLASPCMKDVTKDYYETMNVPVKLVASPPINTKFAYLSVFDNKNWVPVAWSKVEGTNCLFKDMNRNIVYLPSYYFQYRVIPAAYPVLLHNDGKITSLKPNLQKRETVILNRKYQPNFIAYLGGSLVGGRFQVANDSTFKDAVDIYKIENKPEICYQVVDIPPTAQYRYFRYVFAENKTRRDIAEIEVYEHGAKAKLTGQVIGKKQPKTNPLYANVFDGITATKYRAPDADSTWVGLAFDSPKSIRRIAYLPANDDNCICNGELYELFYWDSQWVSLGKQTGSNETYRLTYTNVPTNALLLLRNLTKGKDERIFTYERGKQVWW